MRVEFAYPYTGADGKKYKADEAADLERGLAADLIAQGVARRATPTPADVAKTAKTES